MGGSSNGNGNFFKWKNLSFNRSSKSKRTNPEPPPPEYTCLICNSLLLDPVIIGSGYTVDRFCVQVCQSLNFNPLLPDGTRPDLSTLIPNLALQSAIPNWCAKNGVVQNAKDHTAVERIVRGLIDKELIDAVPEKADLHISRPLTMLTRRVNRFDSASSGESGVIALAFERTPACWTPEDASSSPELLISEETLNPNPNSADEKFIVKFMNSDPYEQEQAAISLRRATRTDEASRVSLCTPRLLLNLRPVINSGYEKVQMNAIAALVNLSLAKQNKIKIVRSGIVPTVIDLLKGRSPESQEHAAGVIFSLSLDDDNRSTLGFLGVLPPLMYCLSSSESERTRSDSALALYHLSLVQSNRVKLVKLGAVPPLLAALQSETEEIAGRVLLVVCNLAASTEGKSAMLDNNAVELLVGFLRRGSELRAESTRENCVAALYTLGRGSMRFKALAKKAAAAEVLAVVAETGGERGRENARRVLLMLKERQGISLDGWDEEDESPASLIPGEVSRFSHRIAGAGVGKSTEF